MKILLVTHRADNDGRTCHAILEPHYARLGCVTALGWDYGDPVPDPTPFDLVVIADIAIPEILDGWARKNPGRLVWIDHHRSAMTPDRAHLPGLRYEGIAACRLAWWFTRNSLPGDDLRPFEENPFPGEPHAVFLLGLRDVWKHKGTQWERPASALNAALMARPGDLPRCLHHHALAESLIAAGETLLAADAERNRENAGRAAHIAMFHGLRVLALNTPERGSALLETHPLARQVDALLVWCHTGGGNVVASLYHAPGQEHRDLSEIAKANGGGGHPGACGFIGRAVPLLSALATSIPPAR